MVTLHAAGTGYLNWWILIDSQSCVCSATPGVLISAR